MEAETGLRAGVWMERAAREVSGRVVPPATDLINECVLCCSEQQKG